MTTNSRILAVGEDCYHRNHFDVSAFAFFCLELSEMAFNYLTFSMGRKVAIII